MPTDAQGYSDEGGTSDNMYAEYLEKFPEDVRPTAEAVFKEWDGNVTRRFQKNNEEYIPYKGVIDAYEPDYLAAGARLLDQLSESPERVIELIQTTYGLNKQEAKEVAKEVQRQGKQNGYELPPEVQEQLAKQQEMLDGLYRTVAGQQEAQQEAVEMAQFESLLENLGQKHGEYDYDYVLGLISAGWDPEDAVIQYHGLVEQLSGGNGQVRPAPKVSGNGGYPANDINYGQISSKDRQDIVAQLLMSARDE